MPLIDTNLPIEKLLKVQLFRYLGVPIMWDLSCLNAIRGS